MKIHTNSIIGEIVADNYRTAEVFRSYGVDFCCKGNRTLIDLLTTADVDIKKLIIDLESTNALGNEPGQDFDLWHLDILADYIEKKHHKYVLSQIPMIEQYLNKLCTVHGKNNPELLEIQKIFTASTVDLVHHMEKEEKILFPQIRNMVSYVKRGIAYEPPIFSTVNNPIQMMMAEHSQEGDRYREIASLSNNYTPPPTACNTYIVTYAMLKEFEENLHTHIHLENNILFPGAIKYEASMSN